MLWSFYHAELETEMYFLANELEAFRYLEQSQRVEIESLKRNAAPTVQVGSPSSRTSPVYDERGQKGAVADEACSQSLHSMSVLKRLGEPRPDPLQRSARLPSSQSPIIGAKASRPAASAPPRAQMAPGGGPFNSKEGWTGGGWKKALRRQG